MTTFPVSSSVTIGILLNRVSLSDEADDPELSIIFDQMSDRKYSDGGRIDAYNNRKTRSRLFHETALVPGRLNPATPHKCISHFHSINDHQGNTCSNKDPFAIATNNSPCSFRSPKASRIDVLHPTNILGRTLSKRVTALRGYNHRLVETSNFSSRENNSVYQDTSISAFERINAN